VAKFLDTTGVSYHLQQLINQSQDTLILISPYLKINERLRQSLDDKDRMKIDIRVVYGKNELQPDQINWLKSLKSVRTSFCENLHAKCYLNESEAIVTSMNLYEFSQVNNQEMGIYVTKTDDPRLYDEIYNEARRLIRISDEVRLSVEKIVEVEGKLSDKGNGKKAENDKKGVCIRCKKEVALNPSTPYCIDCYKSWKKYENFAYQEKYCHLCGKDNASTMSKPVCFDCYKEHKELFAAKN
jgi:phosphatidylserine/phosphatidylglycerophosphate/cardiolipin synthase-like enzyme